METKDYFSFLVNEIHTTVVATVDDEGLPVTAAIDMMDHDDDSLYFLTAKGKGFYDRLVKRGFLAFTTLKGEDTMSSVALSVRGKVKELGYDKIPELFEKNTYMHEIYPTEESMHALTVFHNTQPAIIEPEVFEKVQEIRSQRHRRSKTGKSHMFSGLVYCADCKSRMYYCTTSYFEERQDHFVCSNYRSNTGSCSAHFIRAVVLEQMVWEHVKEIIWYVGHHEGHFRSIMEAGLQSESKEILRSKQKQLERDEKRIAELDRLFIRLYEDNVASRISDERFAMMSRAYEDEQAELKTEAEVLRQEIETQEQQNQNLELFIQKVRKYADMTELTPYAAHELIKAIYVGAPDKSSGKRRQSIHICYDLIGFIPLSELMEQEMA